jgi:hypothetical protein
MPFLLECQISVGFDDQNVSTMKIWVFLFSSDWGESTTEKSERQMAAVIDGEDWDREAHVGHLFNEEELRQLNG